MIVGKGLKQWSESEYMFGLI